MNTEKIALHVSIVTIIGNLFLTLIKFFAGFFGHSSALISDAIHSASDVLSTLVVIVGVKLSNKEEDELHPYGHERLECVAALILAIMLGITGIGIGSAGINMILKGNESLIIPSTITWIVAIISIVSKEAMYWYTRIAAKKINSGALLADAWHHRSDALSSIGSLIGIIGAKSGFPILDPIASIIICLFILKVAYDIFKDAIAKMVDHACDQKTINLITEMVHDKKEVLNIDDLKTRLFGNKIYIDMEISMDKNASLFDTHQVAQEIHDTIENTIPEVKHCMIHINPGN